MGMDEKWAETMRSKNLICILLASMALVAMSGCVAEDKGGAEPAGLAVPKENLPEGFKLLAALPENDQSVNMTGYIKDFYGAKEIGPAKAAIGIYQWGTPGEAFDARITLVQLQDEEHARAAVKNYESLDEYQRFLDRGIPIFGNATINGHPVLEIKDPMDDLSIKRYIYLWNTGSTVVLVEGNGDLGKSRDLASATGL